MKSRGTCRRLDHHKGGYEQRKSCTHDQTSMVWCKLCTWNYVEAWLAFWFATRRLHGSAASRSAARVPPGFREAHPAIRTTARPVKKLAVSRRFLCAGRPDRVSER